MKVSDSAHETLVRLPAEPLFCHNFTGRVAREHDDRPRIDVTSPYTGARIGSVPDSDAAAVARVVAVSKQAAPGWAETPIKERTVPLFRFRELVLQHLDGLGHSAAAECGKTVDEAKAGVLKGVEVVEYALSLQNLALGASLEVSRGVRCESRREPLGVVCGITPFNFPAMVPMWMFPIAITLGNAFILKPSEKVPLTAGLLAELMIEAGYPDGVFSVAHGGRAAVDALLAHPDVSAYGFVGSSRVASEVYARGAALGKRVLALGGAKNTMILAADADPDLAVSAIVASFTGCAGQRCMAGSLLVAVGDCEALIDKIEKTAANIRLGRDMGAIIDASALSRLETAIAQGVVDGAALRLDGRKPTAPSGYEGGHWLAPTILDNVPAESSCAKHELFGPVLSIVRVPNIEAALALEHESPYGNATSVFTQNGAIAARIAERAESGMIGINVGVPVPREPFSFGGSKGSRFGHGDITGQGGVELWTKLKKITTKWAPVSNGSWMG
jgi:malonate-semialdehyde dehydrogenase (acetylating)/methylmalonate-semialdehyde dehydrogenase